LGRENSFFGAGAGTFTTEGMYNSFLGYGAGSQNTLGNYNSFAGAYAGRFNTEGSNNAYFGMHAGYSNSTGNGNLFMGYKAGYNETGSNKLYISNSETSSPLIYGEFDNQYLEVNGTLNVQTGNTIFSVDDTGVVKAQSFIGEIGMAVKADDYTYMNQEAYSDTNWKGGFYVAKRARGTSAAPAVVQNADTVFTFDAQAWDGSAWARGGQIMGKVEGTPSAGKIPFYWTFRTMGNDGVLGDRLIVNSSGYIGIGVLNPTHLIHLAGGAYSNGTTWVNASSRELKKNIKEVSAEEAIQTVENLKPVAFNYKKGEQDLHVGFIAEDVPELVATSDRKGLESMDIVAVLTKVVQEQQKEDKKLRQIVQEQQTMIQELLKRDEEQQTKIGQLETALQFKQNKNADLAKAN